MRAVRIFQVQAVYKILRSCRDHAKRSTKAATAASASALIIFLIACGSSPTAPTSVPPPVIPTLTGQWTGTYTVTNCTESGSAVGSSFCTNLGRGGTHTFTPQQSGSNLAGTLGLGQFSIPVTGNVGTDNVVVLSGSGDIVGALLTLNTWRAVVTGSSMTGTMTFTITVANPIGAANVSATTALTR